MMNYNNLKQKFNAFELTEEFQTYIKNSNIYEILLDSLNNKDEDNTLFLLNNFFKDDGIIPLNDDMKIEIMKAIIDNVLGNVYDYFSPLCFKKTSGVKFNIFIHYLKSPSEEEILEFLNERNFFEKSYMDECIKQDNDILHLALKNNDYYIVGVLKHVIELLKNKDYIRIPNFIKLEFLGIEELYMSNSKDLDLLKQHEKLDMFKYSVDNFLYEAISQGKDEEIVDYFKELGGKIENISYRLIRNEFNKSCVQRRLKTIKLFIRENIDFSNKCLTAVDKMNQKLFEEVNDLYEKNKDVYDEIAKILFEHLKEEDKTSSFFLLSNYFSREYIKEIYEKGFRLDEISIGISYMFNLNKDSLHLLNELDENFINFLKINVDKIKDYCCDEESIEYIKSIL